MALFDQARLLHFLHFQEVRGVTFLRLIGRQVRHRPVRHVALLGRQSDT